MRNNFRVTVSDGSIVIKDLDTEKVFMKYKSDDIVKSDLKFMLVAGGWGGSGHFHKVEPKGNFISKTIFKYFKFLGNDSIRMVRLNSGNFEIFYPSEFYSILRSREKSVLK